MPVLATSHTNHYTTAAYNRVPCWCFIKIANLFIAPNVQQVMGIRGALILALLVIPMVAAQMATIGPYTATLAVEPAPPVMGQPSTIRITIRGADGQIIPEFSADVNMYHTAPREQDEFIYHLEGTFSTSDLLIPYQFQQSGMHWVVVDIPGVPAVQDGTLSFEVLPQARGERSSLRTQGDQLWFAIAIALMALIAVLYWRGMRKN